MASVTTQISKALVRVFGSRNERMVKSMLAVVAEVNSFEPQIERLSDADLGKKTAEFRDRLTHGETLDDLLPEAFAVVREASRRVIWTPDPYRPRPMRHFDVQIVGGIVLHRGMIAEMVTGEGKTLVANLATYLNALPGKGVHIVTVNDYLASRDCAWMRPMYELLGMTAGAIQSQEDYEPKREAYACDVTYGQASEFGFDYLRDNMRVSIEQQVQHERHFGIVDEVDSVLIDEARTPLIISGPAEESTEKYYEADRVARRLKKDAHFAVKEKEHQVHLTDEGVEAVERALGVDSIYSGRNQDWPHYIEQSLVAHNLKRRDVDYVAKSGEIIIVDEFTGRLQPGRRWSDGLHQAIEAKEGIRIKEENQTLATITYQNFFRLYDKLAGMTGTAMTEAEEFMKIYNLDVVAIPTNKPLRRVDFPDVVFRTKKEKFDSLEDEIVEHHATGRPLLVGTIAIETSEMLSDRLKRRGIKHEVLNAKQHEREAQIVAQSGQLGHVTIATNMAGRGTDIVLGRFSRDGLLQFWLATGLAPKHVKLNVPDDELERILIEHWARHYLDAETLEKTPRERWQEKLNAFWRENSMQPLKLCTSVAELGGLQVIGTERHEARRIDNQLRGRSGRQGDPGASRFFLALEDDVMRIFAPERVGAILGRLGMTEGMAIEHSMVTNAIARAQRKVEEHYFDMRKHVLEYDEVPNEHRKTIYARRQHVLSDETLRPMVTEMIRDGLYDEIDRAISSEDTPEERNYRPLADWARDYGVDISADEWRESDLAALQQLFAERAAQRAPADREVLARQFVDAALAFFCIEERAYAEWQFDEVTLWARSIDQEEMAARLREQIEETLVARFAERAAATWADAEVDDLLDLLAAYGVDTFLPDVAGADEWDFDGLARWGNELKISLPAGQWRMEEPSEHDVEMGVDRRKELRDRIRQRAETALRRRPAQEAAAAQVTFEVRRQLRSLGAGDEAPSYRPLVAWLNRSMKLSISTSDLRQIAAEQRDVLAGRLAAGVLTRHHDQDAAQLALWCYANLLAAFLRCDLATPRRDFVSLAAYVHRKYGVQTSPLELSKQDIDTLGEGLLEPIAAAYDRHEQSVTPAIMRQIEKIILLEKIDGKWKDHLYAMDHLRSGIGLRGYAQLDPKVEYTREARRMFDEMSAAIADEVTDLILKVRPAPREEVAAAPRNIWGGAEAIHPASMPGLDSGIHQQQEAAIAGSQQGEKPRPIVSSGAHVGRNAPCPCGSGKKYKKCCGRNA